MERIYFEDIHCAADFYPYLDFSMENINYIAHFHEEIEVIYVITGELNVNTENQELRLSKGDICFFMPGEIHSFQSSENNHIYIIKYLPHSPNEKINFAQLRVTEQPLSSKHPSYSAFRESIQNIAAEGTMKEWGYEFAVNQQLNRLTCLFLRNLNFVSICAENRKRLEKRTQLLKQVSDYIKKHYTEPLCLDNMASFCGYSRYYFAHYFKEATGMSFMDYLAAFRLERAAVRMEVSGESFTEIAYACGFQNIRTFNRMFRKYYHITPTEYRRQQLLQNADRGNE